MLYLLSFQIWFLIFNKILLFIIFKLLAWISLKIFNTYNVICMCICVYTDVRTLSLCLWLDFLVVQCKNSICFLSNFLISKGNGLRPFFWRFPQFFFLVNILIQKEKKTRKKPKNKINLISEDPCNSYDHLLSVFFRPLVSSVCHAFLSITNINSD